MSELDYLARQVGAIHPGQCIRVSAEALRLAWPVNRLAGSAFAGAIPFIEKTGTAADHILDKIVGSAYEFSYEQDPMTGDVTFWRRHKPTDGKLRTYVSPDRLEYFRKRPDGLYEIIK